MATDWRALLKAYLGHIAYEEGSYYLPARTLSAEENAALQALAEEVDREENVEAWFWKAVREKNP